VATLADEVGVDAPKVTVVRADAANVAVADGHRGSRLVVSTRLSLPENDRDAALHALVRLRTREALVATALLPALAAVETVALLATLLVGHRGDRTAADRRVNRIHGYEPERDRIPSWAYAVVGVALWILLLPAWVPATVGDRLYVAGGRRDADGRSRGSGPPSARDSETRLRSPATPRVPPTGRRSSTGFRSSRWRTPRLVECEGRAGRRRERGSHGSGRNGRCEHGGGRRREGVRGHDQSERGPLGGRVDRELAAGLAHDPVDQPDTQSVRVS